MARNQRGNESGYSGWRIDRHALLDQLTRQGITPLHPRLAAHHVTFRYPDREAPPAVDRLTVVGYAHNDRIDCVVVRVQFSDNAQSTLVRPDGSTFHCTLSHLEQARPVESNALIAAGWSPIAPFDLIML